LLVLNSTGKKKSTLLFVKDLELGAQIKKEEK
jgi:hypothetical protein